MKAVLLAGGRGSRVNELSDMRNKCMLKIAGTPLLEHNIDRMSRLALDEIVIVVGYKAEEIINHFGNHYGDVRIRYVIQWEQKGLVHAIECAREAIGEHDFLLQLGDEVTIEPKHQLMMEALHAHNAIAVCGVLHTKEKEMIRKTYAVIKDGEDTISRLIEKPRRPFNNIMGTGNCVFRNEMLSYLDFVPTHPERNEKELPDFIQCAIDDGRIVKAFEFCTQYVNINTEEDLKHAESLFVESQY